MSDKKIEKIEVIVHYEDGTNSENIFRNVSGENWSTTLSFNHKTKDETIQSYNLRIDTNTPVETIKRDYRPNVIY